jgi:hypothetical protein
MDKSTPSPALRSVRFIGQGTYEGHFGGRVIPFGPGQVIEVTPAQAEELLARRENGAPVWENATKSSTTSTKPSQADAPSPAKP